MFRADTNTNRKIGKKTPHNNSISSGYTPPPKEKHRSNPNNQNTSMSLLVQSNLELFKSPVASKVAKENQKTPMTLLAETNPGLFKSPVASIVARHPITPTKMIRTTTKTHNIDNETLRDLIILSAFILEFDFYI